MTNMATHEAFELVGRNLSDEITATAGALRSLAQIEDFGDERTYVVPALGLEATRDGAGLIKTVFLHSAGHEGFQAFPFAFQGLTFASKRAEVSEKLGRPIRSGVGRTGPWDAYEQNDRSIHFMYHSEAQSIALVTVAGVD